MKLNGTDTIQAIWGRENEFKSYQNIIDNYSNYSFYVIVGDSYDITKAINYLKLLG